jgi:hypothetical protein
MKHTNTNTSHPKASSASALVQQKADFTSEGSPPPGCTGQTVPPVTEDVERASKARAQSGTSSTPKHGEEK